MKLRSQSVIFLFALWLIGCASSSRQDSRENITRQPQAPRQLASTTDEPAPETPPRESARRWTPRFIQTGSVSGIMVEFTGMKNNKPPNARNSSIELQKYPIDSTGSRLSNVITSTSIINDIGQAFFKVAPGVYLVRHTKEWADRSYIRDVEVREGSYSIIQIQVINPRSSKTGNPSQSTEGR